VTDEEPTSPWARPDRDDDEVIWDDQITWAAPAATGPRTSPPPPSPDGWDWPLPPEPEPESEQGPTTATGWARRSMALVVLVGFVLSFGVARIIGGSDGPFQFDRNQSPGVQFIPTEPSAGNGNVTGAGGATASEADAVAAKVRPGVVDVNTELAYLNATASGTGMVISADGQVLTNNHVIEGATKITATIVDTGKSYTATVLGTDASDDIALLQLEDASGLDTVPIGDSSTVEVGDQVVALGNAGGRGGAPSVKTGTVRAIGQSVTIGNTNGGGFQTLDNLIMTTAPLQSGDSGGPLADADGRVIGIDTAASLGNRYRSGEGVGFAIPMDDAMAVVRQIESGQATDTVHIGPTAFLGVTLVSRTGSGAVVAGVASGSPADSAGLEEGDTITSAGGQVVESAEELTDVIRAHRPGDKVGLQWIDPSGDSHSTTVKLGTGPAG
jgi:S1-C subfamily serine protease